MRRTAILLAGFAILLLSRPRLRKTGREISLQGGFSPEDTTDRESLNHHRHRRIQVGYRYNFNRGSAQKPGLWLRPKY